MYKLDTKAREQNYEALLIDKEKNWEILENHQEVFPCKSTK